jgi:DNA-binding NtrC family response regulator
MKAVAKQKVFVVDDEKQIARLLSVVLRESKFDVETFFDARSALERASNCLPDILVSDITMPAMDGVTLAESVRERNPSCKIILMSGNPNWGVHGALHLSSLDGFILLPKPFAIKELLSLIKSE